MKKIIAISFLFTYIMATTEILELLKIPMLFSHYFEHQTKNEQITFFIFLNMHYSDENSHFKNDHKDTKLPFKSDHSCFSCFSFVTLVAPIQFFSFEQNTCFYQNKNCNFGTVFSFISNFHSSIWQPPKIC